MDGTPRAAARPMTTEAAGPDVVDRIDVTAVNSEKARQLYKARAQIYPKLVAGPFRAFKWVFLVVSLGIYYLLPWVRWPRGVGEPDQAVLVDFAGRRFYFFFIEIWPQEVYYITGLLVISALLLFLATALFGRVWCGYACPQTVWTDLFIAVERMVEGDRNKRMRLDKQPLSVSKVSKKLTKHAIWLLIGFATGGAWILYFHDAPTLARDFFTGAAPATAYLFAGILTFTTYSLAGLMREQVCTYMCPWPRIQGAMTDAETLQVTYRYDRGEPRGRHKKGESWDNRGDCVECQACVAACPMGIDIRDGDQLECINCALCIDACDDIMVKVGRPKGLIAYDTHANVDRRGAGQKPKVRLIRPRTVVYSLAVLVVGAVMLTALTTRATLDLNVLRDRNPNFVTLNDGSVRNGYSVKILNMDDVSRDFFLDVDAPAGSSLRIVGMSDLPERPVLTVPGDFVGEFRVFVTVPPEAITARSLSVGFTVTDTESGETKANPTMFQTGYTP